MKKNTTIMIDEEFEDEELDLSERAIDYRCALTDMGKAFNVMLNYAVHDKSFLAVVVQDQIVNAVRSIWENCPDSDETLAISLTNAGEFTWLNKFLQANDLPCIHD